MSGRRTLRSRSGTARPKRGPRPPSSTHTHVSTPPQPPQVWSRAFTPVPASRARPWPNRAFACSPWHRNPKRCGVVPPSTSGRRSDVDGSGGAGHRRRAWTGRAIVNRLAKDGFRVAACDLLVDDLAAVVQSVGGDAVVAIPLDVTSEEQWQAAVASAIDRFGSLTTLVNNAGVLHRASLADETTAGFENSWRVNCLGPFLGIRACLEHQ